VKVKTQSKKVNKSWLNDHVNDPYVKLAQKEGYRARAAYKLKEIDEAFKLIKPGQVVVDLGSAPGAWSQYLRRRFSPDGAAVGQLQGTIIALDLLPMDAVEGVHFIQGDFTQAEVLQQVLSKLELLTPENTGQNTEKINKRRVDVVGIASSDAARIAELIELAVDFAQLQLKPEGALVVKLFHGSGYSQLVKLFKDTFKVVKPIKPKSSRDKSAETFLVGMGLKSVA
jgi:23S rRNA (uridine2552-2'-O)-methyltransferase